MRPLPVPRAAKALPATQDCLLAAIGRHPHAGRIAGATLRVLIRDPCQGGKPVGAGTAVLVDGAEGPTGRRRLLTAAHVACALPDCTIDILDADGATLATAEVVARARPWIEHACHFVRCLPRGDMAVLEAVPLAGAAGAWSARPGLELAPPTGNELLTCFSAEILDLRGASGGPMVGADGRLLGILTAGCRLREDGVTLVVGEAPWDPHILWALGSAGAEAARSPWPDLSRWPHPATLVGFPAQVPWAVTLPLEPWREAEPNPPEAAPEAPFRR